MQASVSGTTAESLPVILIVEDDLLIRTAAAQHLRGCNLAVIEANDVGQALDLLSADKSVRVGFIDVDLPGGSNGLDLLRTIQRDYRHVKVLLTTGMIEKAIGNLDGVTLLSKPYFLFEVERHIRSLLAQGRPVPSSPDQALARPLLQ